MFDLTTLVALNTLGNIPVSKPLAGTFAPGKFSGTDNTVGKTTPKTCAPVKRVA